MHTYFRIFAMSSFIKNTNKHAFLLQIVSHQNRCSYLSWAFRPYALFQSKKHNKKRNKNNAIKYKRVQKSMPKSSFFVDFFFQILWKTIVFQHCFERVLTYERLFSWLSVNLTFRSKKHSKKRVKNTYLNTMDSRSNAKKLQKMYFFTPKSL